MSHPYWQRVIACFWISMLTFCFLSCFAGSTSTPAAAAPKQTVAPATTAAPAQGIAQVVWVSGIIKDVAADKSERILKRRDVIYEKDTLVTSANASGQIVFTDSSTLSLREKSEIKISKYQFSPKGPKSDNNVAVEVVKGGFRTITGLISKDNPNGYQANSPVGTIGVRGTQYSVVYDINEKKLYAMIELGKIIVSNEGGSTVLDATAKSLKSLVVNSPKEKPVLLSHPPIIFESHQPPLLPAATPTPESLVTTTTSVQSTTVNSSTTTEGTTSRGSGGTCFRIQ